MEKKNFRHGDVIVVPVDTQKMRGKPEKHLTLAEGEVTGHSHQISEGKAKLYRFDEKTYLRVISPFATLTHEEHNPIKLPAGDYEIFIQQDYEPSGWKKVQD